MYKTAIAHVEGNLSYDEALKQFAISYPEYEIRGIKQASGGWMAFIQKNALHNEDLENVLDESDETEMFSPGADQPESVEEDLEEAEEPSYEEVEEKEHGLLDELESALEKVEQLVLDLQENEEVEEDVRPFGEESEVEELEEGPEEGFEMEIPLELEREKEAGVTFTSAVKEVEELVAQDAQFRGYKVASFKEEPKRFIATLVKE